MTDIDLKLTRTQLKWLGDHGDRNETDVRVDDQGLLYVFMGAGKEHASKRVYLPQKVTLPVHN